MLDWCFQPCINKVIIHSDFIPNIPYPTLDVLLMRNCSYALSFIDQNQIPTHTHFGYVWLPALCPLNGMVWAGWYKYILILIQCRILKISVQNFYFIEFYLLALSDMAGTPEPGVPIYFCGPKTFSSPQWEDLI